MAYAFQREDILFSSGSGFGAGGSGFGIGAFGGSLDEPYELPFVQIPSNDPEKTNRRFVGSIRHEREGVILGERVFATPKRWRFHYASIGQDVVTELLVFFESRIFTFLPDTSAGDSYPVRWVEKEFDPVPLPGSQSRYRLTFTIETRTGA